MPESLVVGITAISTFLAIIDVDFSYPPASNKMWYQVTSVNILLTFGSPLHFSKSEIIVKCLLMVLRRACWTGTDVISC